MSPWGTSKKRRSRSQQGFISLSQLAAKRFFFVALTVSGHRVLVLNDCQGYRRKRVINSGAKEKDKKAREEHLPQQQKCPEMQQ
jgi:hypothetical protein